MTYNIQESFHKEGYFKIKFTPLEANLALLEEQEDKELQALTIGANDWLG